MMRRVVLSSSLLAESQLTQQRGIRYANIQETLKPAAGNTAGQLSVTNEICANPDAEEERRKPSFRPEVRPRGSQIGHSYLSTMHRWGYNSLTLFLKVNEDPGPWWNANASTLSSTWTSIGDYANAGMWSGVWRYTYGVGQYNLRPFEARGAAWGRRVQKVKGAVSIDYADKLAATPAQKFFFPHTKEHQMHHRIKNPALPEFVEIDALHGKRVMREIQHHLSNGIRFYLVDGVFGSYGPTATPFRIITDNPTSAYFASLAAIRKQNYVSREETVLVKRVSQSPLDEWGWRRPGVLVYHTPGYDFEAPRIVEEFGGPRPQDLSLKSPKFIALEPYSIPMKGIVAAEPKSETLLDTIAFLSARWGFYADGKKHLTLKADAVLSKSSDAVTVVVGAGSDLLKGSRNLFAAHHVRFDESYVSRTWDVTSVPNNGTVTPAAGDLVEGGAVQRIQKSLPLRVGLDAAKSHRLFGRRRVSEFGYKWPHNYTDDVASKADQGGHLFNGAATNKVKAFPVRPNAIRLSSTDFVVIGEKDSTSVADAVSVILSQLKASGFLYAEPEKLSVALESALTKAKSVKVVSASTAGDLLKQLAQQ